MSNIQITNGVIKYGRTIKTGDFESKRGDVELSFNIPEGEDHDTAVAHVQEKAQGHLFSLLGHPGDTTDRARPPKALKEEKPVAKAPKKLPAAVVDASVMEDPEVPPLLRGKVAAQKPAEVVEENIDDLLQEGEEVAQVTDQELNDATQKCQSRAKNAPAIRKLLGELGVRVPPGRIIDLAQEKRREYLNRLEEIKPLA